MSTIHRKRSFCLGIVLFLATGCSLFKSEPTITPIISITAEISVPIQPNDLEYGKCPFEVPSDIPPEEMPELLCANLTVPQDWQSPNPQRYPKT